MAVEPVKRLNKTLFKNIFALKQLNIEKSFRKNKNNNFKNNMPKSIKLQNKIEKKLDRLEKLLNKIDDARAINSDDPDTWDSDTLYDLVANLKEAIKLLEDKTHPQEKDNFGEPLILEDGLCSLVDEYHSEEEEYSED
jgi:hypothetical protein